MSLLTSTSPPLAERMRPSRLEDLVGQEHLVGVDGIIRKAIASYVEQNRPVTADAFGIWKDRQVDGLDYQETIRSEW